MISCGGGEITSDRMLDRLRELPEHSTTYFYPLPIGEQMLTGDDHTKSNEYIQNKYGKLIEAGLVNVEIVQKNAWRTLINVSLSEAGLALSDASRSDSVYAYVAACKIVPDTVYSVREVTLDTIECNYGSSLQEVTPFGEYLEFTQGKKIDAAIKLKK